ncbi:hypothetical protein [Brachybacterium sp. YJGR34]|uniref:hypothetical protein n=1 Tax=Brachybacterium sp. YJGR34 TaxID=2059911 RepID=UPI000E0C99A6|nr:hypothetical protein [Brachybacterium sp. YJGR34]
MIALLGAGATIGGEALLLILLHLPGEGRVPLDGVLSLVLIGLSLAWTAISGASVVLLRRHARPDGPGLRTALLLALAVLAFGIAAAAGTLHTGLLLALDGTTALSSVLDPLETAWGVLNGAAALVIIVLALLLVLQPGRRGPAIPLRVPPRPLALVLVVVLAAGLLGHAALLGVARLVLRASALAGLPAAGFSLLLALTLLLGGLLVATGDRPLRVAAWGALLAMALALVLPTVLGQLMTVHALHAVLPESWIIAEAARGGLELLGILVALVVMLLGLARARSAAAPSPAGGDEQHPR